MNRPTKRCEQIRDAGTDFRYGTGEKAFPESPVLASVVAVLVLALVGSRCRAVELGGVRQIGFNVWRALEQLCEVRAT